MNRRNCLRLITWRLDITGTGLGFLALGSVTQAGTRCRFGVFFIFTMLATPLAFHQT